MRKLLSFLFPKIVGTYPLSVSSPVGIEQNGGIANNGGLLAFLNSLFLNASPAAGTSNFQTSAAAALTLTNIAGATIRLTNGGAVTLTLDNAPNIVNSIAGPYLGMSFPLAIAATGATTVATPTVTNTGVTLSGTTSILAAAMRWFQGQITQMFTQTVTGVTAGTTFTSITQIGSTNLYTLALGTNAITSVVGNLIYIGVTAGTLPAGFYPTYSAGTTSIVVALPPNSTAWTATAATMVAPTTVPATFAPLITLTGTLATATAVITV